MPANTSPTLLKNGQRKCAVCGFVFTPSQGGQVCCNTRCSLQRERDAARNRRRIATPQEQPNTLAANVPAKSYPAKHAYPEPEPAHLYDPVRWVINPLRRVRPLRAGEPLYVQTGTGRMQMEEADAR